MALTLVDIKANTRGKNTREVVYKGVGKFVTEKTEKRETVDGRDKIVKDKDGKPVMVDVLVLKTAGIATDIKDALEVENGDMQSLLDNWAVGFNLNAYKGVSDALSEYIKDSWSKDHITAFRGAVNNLVKLGVELDKAVEIAASKLPA